MGRGEEEYEENDDEPGQEIPERPEWFPSFIIRRNEWGAVDVEKPNYDLGVSTEVMLTFTDLQPCYTREACVETLRSAQKADKESGLVDIKYNFYIGNDGNIYEGRGWTAVPDAPDELSSSRGRLLAVGLMGKRGDQLEEPRIKAFKELMKLGKEHWLITPHAKIHTLLRIIKLPDFILEMMEKHGPNSVNVNPEGGSTNE